MHTMRLDAWVASTRALRHVAAVGGRPCALFSCGGHVPTTRLCRRDFQSPACPLHGPDRVQKTASGIDSQPSERPAVDTPTSPSPPAESNRNIASRTSDPRPPRFFAVMKFPSLGRHASKRPTDAVTKAKKMMKKDGGKLADDILRLPLDSLMALPIEVLDDLPPSRLILLPSQVLLRLSPNVIATVPPTHFNEMLLQLPAEARANLSPGLFAKLPRTHFRNLPLATLEKLPGKVLTQLDLARLEMLPRLADLLRDTPAGLRPHPAEMLSWMRYLADTGSLALPPTSSGPQLDQAPVDTPDSTASAPSPREDGPPATAPTPALPNLDDDSDVGDSAKAARLNVLTRERDALRGEVARLDAARRTVSENIHKVLEISDWDDWDPDRDPFEQIVEFAAISAGLAKEYRDAQQYWTKEHEEETSQRLALEKTVQDLTAKLAEQTQQHSAHATRSRDEHKAEIKRLQQVIEKQDKRYESMMRGQEERHSATVKRLIDEHTAEISDQMTVYEKELAELRAAHEQKVEENPDTKGAGISPPA